MDTQIFSIILVGSLILVIIFFGLDIYYLIKKPKGKEEKDAISSKISEMLLPELEKTIGPEIKKAVSEINQKISDEMVGSCKKQMAVFSESAGKKIADWEEINKNEILKISSACSEAENLILQEAKKRTGELGKDLNERIDQIYRIATESVSQKIEQAEKNIEDYKKEKLKEIDQKIYQIIEDVAKKTIGKSIDLSSHEELVIQALEKARRENFF